MSLSKLTENSEMLSKRILTCFVLTVPSLLMMLLCLRTCRKVGEVWKSVLSYFSTVYVPIAGCIIICTAFYLPKTCVNGKKAQSLEVREKNRARWYGLNGILWETLIVRDPYTATGNKNSVYIRIRNWVSPSSRWKGPQDPSPYSVFILYSL